MLMVTGLRDDWGVLSGLALRGSFCMLYPAKTDTYIFIVHFNTLLLTWLTHAFAHVSVYVKLKLKNKEWLIFFLSFDFHTCGIMKSI